MLDDEVIKGPDPDDWLIVPNWDKYQHYKDRNPPWIKLYTKLLSDPNFLNLNLWEKGLLMMIWLGYAQTSGLLRAKDVPTLGRGRPNRFGSRSLIALNHAGFLHWSASKPLAPSTEVETEKESPYPLTSKTVANALLGEAINVAADWKGSDSLEFDKRLTELEGRFKRRLSSSERDKLWDEALRRNR